MALESHVSEEVVVNERDVNWVVRGIRQGKKLDQVCPRLCTLGTEVTSEILARRAAAAILSEGGRDIGTHPLGDARIVWRDSDRCCRGERAMTAESRLRWRSRR